jgi:hypothetical protein
MTDTPLRKLIDSGKALQKLKPPAGQDFCVMAYLLASEVKEGMHGTWILLGCYRNEEKAKQVAQHIIQTTGHPNVVWAPTGQWRPLTEKVDVEKTTYVEVAAKPLEKPLLKTSPARDAPVEVPKHDGSLQGSDPKPQLIPVKPPIENGITEMLKQEDAKKEALAAEQKRIREEIIEEQRRSEDPTTIDYYIKLWYLIIRNKAKLDEYQTKPTDKQQMQAAEKIFSERVRTLRELASKRPDMEAKWQETLRERMVRRGEGNIYDMIATGVMNLKPLIFPVPKRVEATIIADSPHHKPKTPPEAPSEAPPKVSLVQPSIPVPEVKVSPVPEVKITPVPEVNLIPEAPELILRPAKPKGPIVKKQVETIEGRKP